MLIRIGALSLLMVVFFHTSALAYGLHGHGTHVMGTVTALDAQHVVVKTKEGKPTSILLDKDMKYRKGEATATSTDLQVGDRVVVHPTGEGDTITASEIRFSSPGEGKGHAGMTHRTPLP